MQREASGGSRGERDLLGAAADAPPAEYDRALPRQRAKKHPQLIDKAKILAYMKVRNAQSEDEDAEDGSKRCADCKNHWKSCGRRQCQHGLCEKCAKKRTQRRTTAQKTYTDNHYIARLEDELEYAKKQIEKLQLKNEQLERETLHRYQHYGNDRNVTNVSTYPTATQAYQYASVPAPQVNCGGFQGPSRTQQQPPIPPPAGSMPFDQMACASHQHTGGAYAGASNAFFEMPVDILEPDETPAAKRSYDLTDSFELSFNTGNIPYMN